MNYLTNFAQAGNYNCTDSSDSSYGAGAFGTCVTDGATTPGGNTGTNTGTSTSTGQPGAPNSGEFFGFVAGGAFSIILPLVVAIAVVSAATFAMIRKKRATQR